MFLNDYGLEKAKSLKEGDMVSWNSSGGRARGKVIHVMDYGTLDIPNTKFKIKGEKDNPAVLIQLYRDGKETDIQVGHKMSSLTKSLDEPLSKHGSHNQKTHAGSRGRGIGGSGAAAQTDPSEKYYDAGYDDELMEVLDEQMVDIDNQFEELAADLLDEKEISRKLDNMGREAKGVRSPDQINEQIKFLGNAQQSSNRARGRIEDASRPVDTSELFNLHRKDVVGGINELDDAINELNRGDSSLKSLANELQGVKSALTDYEDKLDESLLKNDAVRKHGSHNQKTHAGSRGRGAGGSGSGSSTTRPTPTTMPFRPTGKDKLDEALFTRLDRKESNAAYVNGWKQGQAQSKDDKLFSAANSWIDMTDKSINEGKMPNDSFLLETARAVGLVNGMLQAK